MLQNIIIPELNTQFVQGLQLLEERFIQQKKVLEEWFDTEWKRTAPPIYGSVDLRNAGFKLAPIDMNLFPAGFNNLNPNFLSLSIDAAKEIIAELVPHAQKILLIPENHTRNLFYWANVKVLKKILEAAHFNVRLASFGAQTTQNINLNDGDQLVIEPLQRKDNQLELENFVPDLILLNNDLSEGIPEVLQHVPQPIVPPAALGWSHRLKSEHFGYYAQVVAEFAKLLQFDSWLVAPLFRHCGRVNFVQQDGLDCVVSHAEVLFKQIQQKYDEYKIPYQPFLIVKADAGTYGMAVMTVRKMEELTSLNRKQRARMASTKGGQEVSRVIIQEGVYTFETVGDKKAVAEPVVYMWGKHVVGGFYRVHQDRGNDENLNSPGMRFEPLAFAEACHRPCTEQMESAKNRFYIYGVIARLSMLAAAREIKDQIKK